MQGQVVMRRRPSFASARICLSMRRWWLSSVANRAISGPASMRTFCTQLCFQSGARACGRRWPAHGRAAAHLAQAIVGALETEPVFEGVLHQVALGDTEAPGFLFDAGFQRGIETDGERHGRFLSCMPVIQ